jgi:oligoribonuclease NrnB/cAMP/cGMP phosphodiesterase (DHH superfamily)
MTHGNDVDGLASAAIIMHRYNVPARNVFFLDYSDRRLEFASGKIINAARPGDSLIITDIGINRQQAERFSVLIKGVKGVGGRVLWFDHHAWNENAVRGIAALCDIAVVGDTHFCASEITAKELGTHSRQEDRLVRVAHCIDRHITENNQRSINRIDRIYGLGLLNYNLKGVAAANASLRKVVSELSRYRILNRIIKREAGKMARINAKRIAVMLSELYAFGGNMCIGFSKTVLPSQACYSIMRRAGSSIGIYVNTEEGRGHIWSESIDILRLASALGGGGHSNAAGFLIDMRKYNWLRRKSDRQRLVKRIETAATRML